MKDMPTPECTILIHKIKKMPIPRAETTARSGLRLRDHPSHQLSLYLFLTALNTVCMDAFLAFTFSRVVAVFHWLISLRDKKIDLRWCNDILLTFWRLYKSDYYYRLDRFSRFISQTTCFRPRMVLLGVRTMGGHIWGKYAPKTPQKWAWIGNF